MRIRVLSDLHEEFRHRLPPLDLPWVPADVTVLAGDIANGPDALEVAQRPAFAGSTVLVVPGNHEYYDARFEPTRETLRRSAAGLSRVHVLDDDQLQIDGVRFIGTTLWTDYRLEGVERRALAMARSGERVLDHRKIMLSGDRMMAPADALALHEAARAFVERELARAHRGPTVVVSHHAPHPGSVAERFAGDPINAAFVSDLEPLLAGADLWIHGHTHDSFDYRVGRTRVIANPAGYRAIYPGPDGEPEVVFENGRFDPGLVIEL
ncbi:MAG: metallophosphoesterase [Burkholderiales bacterium]|nr:MAG: metallophosphoesterase [Burkholderiales bacterium]